MGIRTLSTHALALLALTGCNALLGNDEGTGTSSDPSAADKNSQSEDTASAGDASSTTKKPDSGAPSVRTDDSKAPCQSCEPELIVDQIGRVTSLQVTATHAYWATANGAYRVALSAAPCQKTDCFETFDTGGFGQVSVAVSDTNVYWSTIREFGVVDLATMKTKKADAALLKPSGSVMTLVGDYAYYVQSGYTVGSQATLVRGNADKLAAGTGSPSLVSESGVGIDTFTATSEYVAWATNAHKVYVQPTAQPAVEIPMPSSTSGWWINSLSVHNGYAYISAFYSGEHVYRAPIDGSEEASGYCDQAGPRHIVVNAGGTYIAFGDVANGLNNGISWNPIDSKAKGAVAGKQLIGLDTFEVMKMQVTDDAIYYATYPSRGGGSPAIWRIRFEP